jgi:hypothetical protein
MVWRNTFTLTFSDVKEHLDYAAYATQRKRMKAGRDIAPNMS